ncbi:hypothetical protein NPIL_295531, partial [Nephila pilipes]
MSLVQNKASSSSSDEESSDDKSDMSTHRCPINPSHIVCSDEYETHRRECGLAFLRNFVSGEGPSLDDMLPEHQEVMFSIVDDDRSLADEISHYPRGRIILRTILREIELADIDYFRDEMFLQYPNFYGYPAVSSENDSLNGSIEEDPLIENIAEDPPRNDTIEGTSKKDSLNGAAEDTTAKDSFNAAAEGTTAKDSLNA